MAGEIEVVREFLQCRGCGKRGRWYFQEEVKRAKERGDLSPTQKRGMKVYAVEMREMDKPLTVGQEWTKVYAIEDTCTACGFVQVIRHERSIGKAVMRSGLVAAAEAPPFDIRSLGTKKN